MDFQSLPSVLGISRWPHLDATCIANLVTAVRAYRDKLGPESSELADELTAYLAREVLMDGDLPIAMVATSESHMWGIYGIDLTLVHPLGDEGFTGAVDQLVNASKKVDHEFEWALSAPNLWAPNTAPEVLAGRATVFPIHVADTTRPLSDLKSKQRNEMRKARELHADKVASASLTVPDCVYQAMRERWCDTGQDWIAYMIILWLWVDVLSAQGRAEITTVHDTTGRWVSAIGMINLGDYWMFLAYAQPAGAMQNYIGTFNLITAFEQLSKYTDLPLVLTCPNVAVPHTYELYKRTIAHHTVELPSLLLVDEQREFSAPLFDYSRGAWVCK